MLTHSYDANSQLITARNPQHDRTSFIYDAGNQRRIATATGSVTTYSYNNADQLTREHRTGPSAYRNTYTYDPARCHVRSANAMRTWHPAGRPR